MPYRQALTPNRIRPTLTSTRIHPTPGRITPTRIRPNRPFIPPPRPPQNPPAVAGGSSGNMGNPISITYKFPDPSRPPAGQTQQAQAPQKPPPLINPLPSQAPAPVGRAPYGATAGMGGARYDRDWRRGFRSRPRRQNQSGFTNWLTRPASPPSRFNTFGIQSDRGSQGTSIGVGGGYNAF